MIGAVEDHGELVGVLEGHGAECFLSGTSVALSKATILHLDPGGQRVRHPAERPGTLDEGVEHVVLDVGPHATRNRA